MVSRDILECWRLFVLACRTLCTKSVSSENIKLGDAFLLQFCRRVEHYFGKESITPNMHLNCHLGECMEDYGPVHGFWCYPFERYNGLMGSTPHNNRSIECQMMQRIIRENQALILSEENIPEVLLQCFPKKDQSGSLAETMTYSDNAAIRVSTSYTLDAIQSVISLPKYKYNTVLSNTQKRNITKLYCSLYDVSTNNIEIAQTCFVYKSVQFKGVRFGSYKDRTSCSSIVMTKFDPGTFLQSTISRAARVNKFYEHTVNINGELKVHLLAYLSWFEEHPQKCVYGKPVTIYYDDLFQHTSFIPIQCITSRALSLVNELNGETVMFVVPCVE